MNIRSIRNKLDHVCEILIQHELDILCLTETWLREHDANFIMNALPNSYSLISIPRPNSANPGGGVALIYSLALGTVVHVRSESSPTSFELLEASVNFHQKTIRFAVIYRPGHPGSDRLFMNEFDHFMEVFSLKSGELILCGDFNYWVDKPHLKPFLQEFIELTGQHNFVNHVTQQTYTSGHILDLILTPRDGRVFNIEVETLDAAVSDHALISFCYDVPKPASYVKLITFRNYMNIDQDMACSDVDKLMRDVEFSNLSSDELVEVYNAKLKIVFDRHCPVIKKRIVVRDDRPWYSSVVKHLRRERRKAERKWRQNKTDLTWSQYTLARGNVVTAIKNEKIKYYQGKVDSCGTDQKKLFSVVNSLLGGKSVNTKPSSGCDEALASEFASFFVSKIAGIRLTLDQVPNDHDFSVTYHPPVNSNVVLSSFNPISIESVLSYLRGTKKTYCSLDPANVSKLQRVFEHIAGLITNIVNKCFFEGSFPGSEKHALIRPLLKKPGLDAENKSNYRPISNLSFLSKVLERAMLDQLLPVLQSNGIIPSIQSAYRQHHSTETALTRIHNDLVENTCEGMSSLLVLLDLSAAFDTVDHDLLLQDLYNSGICDTALALFRSYLSHRTQSVVVNESTSHSIPLLYGVPQGSVLGPVLFTIYTSSLSSLLDAHGVLHHFYADDTQVYVKIENVTDTKTRMELLVSDIKIWMIMRKLKLNDDKTDLIIIRGNRRTSREDALSLNIGNSQLQPQSTVRNLGVLFNTTLDYKDHINYIVKCCQMHIRNLYTIKSFINEHCLLLLVHSMVFSRVDYCNALFLGLPNYILKKLQSVLNRSARLIFGLPARTPTTSYLIQLHWLPIKARIEFKVCLLTFKVIKHGEPEYLANLLHRPPTRSGVVVRHDDDLLRLYEPAAIQNFSFSERSFRYMAPRLYNRLPLAIRKLSSVETFKKQLKAFLFQRCYDTQRGVVTDEYLV